MGACITAEPKKMTEKNTTNLIVLGLSGSGKTTFSKQMKIINVGGYQDFELENFRKIIGRNISSGLHELLIKLQEEENKPSEALFEAFQFIRENPNFSLTNENITFSKSIWEESIVQAFWKSHKNSMYNAHLDYYIQDIDRVAENNYVPSFEDIVKCRQYTIGASTTSYYFKKNWFRLIDVGGQKTERNKWKGIVSDVKVKGMIFFVAINEYDVPSGEEDGSKFDLSLKIWEDVTKAPELKGECVMLFFNKFDLFKEMIANKSCFRGFKKKFTDYKGAQDPVQCADYMKEKFVEVASKNGLKEDDIYVNYTCAIDTEQMSTVWDNVVEHVMKKKTIAGGFEL